MRSDIIPGATFPDYELPDLNRPGLREAWDAKDYSPFHGWNRRPPESMPSSYSS
jgi:hypothetical protein